MDTKKWEKGILFDLDGTLWDSAEGVAESWSTALIQLGRPERCTVDMCHRLMGKTMVDIARIMFPDEKLEEAERLLKVCTDAENAWLAERGGQLYEGMMETLEGLKNAGYFLAVVSNCQEGYIEAFIHAHHLEALFDDTECYGHTRKLKGDNVRLVVERNGLSEAIYVGDTMGDYEAATHAGVGFIHAAYGFGTVPQGTAAVKDIRELMERVK